jgi:hypothetical protein
MPIRFVGGWRPTSGTGTEFSRSTFCFFSRYHCTNAPHSPLTYYYSYRKETQKKAINVLTKQSFFGYWTHTHCYSWVFGWLSKAGKSRKRTGIWTKGVLFMFCVNIGLLNRFLIDIALWSLMCCIMHVMLSSNIVAFTPRAQRESIVGESYLYTFAFFSQL